MTQVPGLLAKALEVAPALVVRGSTAVRAPAVEGGLPGLQQAGVLGFALAVAVWPSVGQGLPPVALESAPVAQGWGCSVDQRAFH